MAHVNGIDVRWPVEGRVAEILTSQVRAAKDSTIGAPAGKS